MARDQKFKNRGERRPLYWNFCNIQEILGSQTKQILQEGYSSPRTHYVPSRLLQQTYPVQSHLWGLGRVVCKTKQKLILLFLPLLPFFLSPSPLAFVLSFIPKYLLKEFLKNGRRSQTTSKTKEVNSGLRRERERRVKLIKCLCEYDYLKKIKQNPT